MAVADHLEADLRNVPESIEWITTSSPDKLPISAELAGESPRLAGVDEDHEQVLQEADSDLPATLGARPAQLTSRCAGASASYRTGRTSARQRANAGSRTSHHRRIAPTRTVSKRSTRSGLRT